MDFLAILTCLTGNLATIHELEGSLGEIRSYLGSLKDNTLVSWRKHLDETQESKENQNKGEELKTQSQSQPVIVHGIKEGEDKLETMRVDASGNDSNTILALSEIGGTKAVEFLNWRNCQETSFQMKQAKGGVTCLSLSPNEPWSGLLCLSHLDKKLKGSLGVSGSYSFPETSLILVRIVSGKASEISEMKREKSQGVRMKVVLDQNSHYLFFAQVNWDQETPSPYCLTLFNSENQLINVEKWETEANLSLEDEKVILNGLRITDKQKAVLTKMDNAILEE